jgi:hypothetical protein
MIAPIQQTEPPRSSSELRRARHLVAATLLEQQPELADDAPPVRAWKAWLFVAWVTVTTVVYFAHMARVF